ncbi:MAG TPA: glutamine-hydrolyzing carbamoyl-phosphate synthase small subunit [Limnochordia bacterium]|nr:glutamine-hydrolyzing carbamoyl-phosphate synthase small subunit [Limnochordia bacterium]
MGVKEPAVLVLEDGASFPGEAWAARGKAGGPVVFTTAMTGYQEALTDPAVYGCIVVMTYPMIGNYGVNPEDAASDKVFAHGIVVHQVSSEPSNWRATESLSGYLERQGVVGVLGLDTRALVRHLRGRGALRGVIATGDVDIEEVAEEARALPPLEGRDLVREVTPARGYLFAEGTGPRVTVIDCGAKRSLLQALAERGLSVSVVPAHASLDEIMATRPDGLLVSDGPGDPRALKPLVETVKALIKTTGLPLFGISLGHQVIAQAFGAAVEPLGHGHRGANYPVRELDSGRVYITAQNHGYVVQEASWDDPNLVVSYRNVNDGTIEGLAHRELPVLTVQFDPGTGPGPRETEAVLARFVGSLRKSA